MSYCTTTVKLEITECRALNSCCFATALVWIIFSLGRLVVGDFLSTIIDYFEMHQHQNLDSEVLFLVFFLVKLVGGTQFGPVEILNLTRTTQGRIGLLIKEGDNQRIYVEDVVPEEPAATQGDLRQGDRILEARDFFFHCDDFVTLFSCS